MNIASGSKLSVLKMRVLTTRLIDYMRELISDNTVEVDDQNMWLEVKDFA